MCYLAVDELDIVGALGVTITGSVLGTSFVGGVLGKTTIGVHLDEVESAVKATREVGHIDVEGELLILELKHLVCSVTRHEIHTRTDVGPSNKFEGECGTGGTDTVSARVISTVYGAILGTGGGVGALGGVERVTSVTVRVPTGSVKPAPVCVENDGCVESGAAARLGTFLGAEFGMGFCHLRTNLLGAR